ncbi:MAG: hypothetical protein CM15mP23_20670 [Cryomorphaceae bacterium]|nr:MAG: hypothetical protein CM15mP23_20670 [Cryomorphaceae bacterium]
MKLLIYFLLHRVSEICHKHGAVFHSDTVQTMAHYRFDMEELEQVHFLACSAHKFHGPKGVGFLYVNKSVQNQSFNSWWFSRTNREVVLRMFMVLLGFQKQWM